MKKIQEDNHELKAEVKEIRSKFDSQQAFITDLLSSNPHLILPPPEAQPIKVPPPNRDQTGKHLPPPNRDQTAENQERPPAQQLVTNSYASKASLPENSSNTSQQNSGNRQTAHPPVHYRKQPIYGNRKSNNPISGPSKPFSLFVGGFNLDLTPESMKNRIKKETGLDVLQVTLNKTKYNRSYKIDINPRDKDKAFDPNTWDEGLVVKPFKPKKHRSHREYQNIQREEYPNEQYYQDHRNPNNYNNNFDHNEYYSHDKENLNQNFNYYENHPHYIHKNQFELLNQINEDGYRR